MKALDTLSRNPNGFFLMIEGSNIDKAAHSNNLEEMMEELLDFDRTAGAVLDWASKHPGTLVVITADHNTGAFALTGGSREQGEIRAGSVPAVMTAWLFRCMPSAREAATSPAFMKIRISSTRL